MTFTPVSRISFSLVLLVTSLLFFVQIIGLMPDRHKTVLETRKHLIEVITIVCSTAAEKGIPALIKDDLQVIVAREGEVSSAALRDDHGELLAQFGNHLTHWQKTGTENFSLDHVEFPIFRDKEKWATVELSFRPIAGRGFWADLQNSSFSLFLFMMVATFCGFFFILKRALRELDPSSVIPGRVKAAFDVLKEGVLIFDTREQVVLANSSFANLMGKNPDKFIGVKGEELPWKVDLPNKESFAMPWKRVLQGEDAVIGVRMQLEKTGGSLITLTVNAVPVADEKGICQGVLATFDDVTELEMMNQELKQTVNRLHMTTEEVEAKNRELVFLARHDPLTLLLNRRAFNREFEEIFAESQQKGSDLTCIMCDIDHFKSVNDRFGHATGDRVIRMVSGQLQKNCRETDLVGRYGGEEFCIVLVNTEIQQASAIINRIREAIEADQTSGVKVTMSFGLAPLQKITNSIDELTNQADKALYIAKESGRNRLVCWNDENTIEILEVDHDIDKDQNATEFEQPKDSSLDDNLQEASNEVGSDEVAQLTIRLQEMEALADKRLKELQYYEMYDALTGLPARNLFYDRIHQALNLRKRHENILALLSISIDAVQRIRETLGHEASERLLKDIVLRLKKSLRDVDVVASLTPSSSSPTVTRLGQDEFGVLLTEIEDVNVVAWIVKRIFSTFEATFPLDGNQVHVAMNIGIAICPHDGDTPEELEKNATAAMSFSKKMLGVNKYYFYSATIHAESIKHLQIESQLYRAVQNEEFLVYYQPKVQTKTGDISGLEALIRWNCPGKGLIAPGEFIPIAEYSGLISTIDLWVFQAVCRQLQKWSSLGILTQHVSVNFSAQLFRKKGLAETVRQILQQSNLAPESILIEITETVLMEKIPQVSANIQDMKRMGINFTLDDFGIGYASFGYLRNFPVSSVKIDRSFIREIEKNERDEILVRSMISMGHSMGMGVTAEGVENSLQLKLLEDLECDEIQGYYFSPPVSGEQVTVLLQTGLKN